LVSRRGTAEQRHFQQFVIGQGLGAAFQEAGAQPLAMTGIV